MTTFISSFLGSFIATGIAVYFTAHFFYRLGRKHERNLNHVTHVEKSKRNE